MTCAARLTSIYFVSVMRGAVDFFAIVRRSSIGVGHTSGVDVTVVKVFVVMG